MSLKLKVWDIGIEGMDYVSVFNLKMHVILKDVLVITYLLRQLFFMCYTSVFNVFNLTTLFNVAELV